MTSKEYANAAAVDVRTLPLKSTIGPWCAVGETGLTGTNEQTLTWMFSSENGGEGAILPGTQGSGRPNIQLGLALPDGAPAPKRFESFEPEPFSLLSFSGKSAGEARVFIGELFGQSSPVEVPSPGIGAELRIYPGAEFVFMVNPEFEHGLLALSDGLALENISLSPTTIGLTQTGTKTLHVVNESDESALAILLGGTPL